MKIFKHKKLENDYEDYQKPLPRSEIYWMKSREKSPVDCGHWTRLIKSSDYWFPTMDGGDYISYRECWRCVLYSKIHIWKRKIFTKRFKRLKRFFSLLKIKPSPIKWKHWVPKAWEISFSISQ